MDLEQSLHYELASISGLSTKVFPNTSQQGTTTPYCVYVLVSTDREQELTGHNGMVEARFDIHILHKTYANLKSLMDLVIAKLKTFNLRTIGQNGVFIQQAEIDNEFENFQPNIEVYQGTIEVILYFQE